MIMKDISTGNSTHVRDEGWSVTARRTGVRCSRTGGIEGQRSIALQEFQTNPSRTDQAARALLIGLLCAGFGVRLPARRHRSGRRPGCRLAPAHGPVDSAAPRLSSYRSVLARERRQRVAGVQLAVRADSAEALRVDELQGLMIFTAAMMALIAAAVYHMMSRLQADFTQRAVLTIAVMFCLSRMSTPRPWLFTILFFRAGDGHPDARAPDRQEPRAVWLPLLFALWPMCIFSLSTDCWCWDRRDGAAAGALVEVGNERRTGAESVAGAGGMRCRDVPESVRTGDLQSGRGNWVRSRACWTASRRCWRCRFGRWAIFALLFLALAAAGVLFRYRRLAPFETLMLAMARCFRSARGAICG